MDASHSETGTTVGAGLLTGATLAPESVPAGAPTIKAKPSIWLNGDVLACACPDCGAPMSVRVWLMVADCLHCGASIELTSEQQRQAERLIAERQQPATVGVSAASPPVAPAHQPPPEPKPPTTVSLKKQNIPVAKLVKTGPAIPPPLPPQPPPLPPVAKLVRSAPREKPTVGRSPRRPVWPLVLLLLCVGGAAFALWSLLGRYDSSEVAVAPAQAPGAAKPQAAATWKARREARPAAAPLGAVDAKTERAADALTLPRDASAGRPDLDTVIAVVKTPAPDRMFEGRDPRIRTDVVEEEGGSIYTEAAVAAGLDWLHRHQAGDGSWSLDKFSRCGDCNGQCDGQGDQSDTAATALALLPFLGAGQSSHQGLYQDSVERGVKWLVAHQQPDGSLQDVGTGRMYAHGLATIALCEAVAMSGDDSLRPAAQRAIDYIVRAQHEAGGWRYHPGDEGDTSVVGWQLMALQSGKGAYLDVTKSAFDHAGNYLDTVKSGRNGGLFAYQRGRGPTPAMIAEGLLCRQYLGWPQDNPGLREGIDHLLKRELPEQNRPNIYYWYYATQVMHHVGGEPWKKWNAAVRDALLAMQDRTGHRAGSWPPRGGAIGGVDTRTGGRIYMTSLALCTLEVYYRYLPLYRGIEVER